MENKIPVIPVLLSLEGSELKQLADGSSLPMACLTSYAKHYKNHTLLEFFDFHPLVNHRYHEWPAYETLAQQLAAHTSIWLFSCYAWNARFNLQLAQKIKSILPNAVTIVGGPHIPGYEKEASDFLNHNIFIDIAVRSEGERTFSEILETIAQQGKQRHYDFSAVDGLTYRTNTGALVRTKDRVRSLNLDDFPSPFLTGEFNHHSFDNEINFILETNRGCPYGCTYCDWGAATLQKVRHFDLDRIKKEIQYIASQKNCQTLYIADANFGAFDRDVEIARTLADVHKQYGRPKFFQVNYAKNPSPRIAEIVRILTEAGLVTQGAIALQTIDPQVLRAIDRSNIKQKNMEKMLEIFREQGLPLTSEFLIGLPGQDLQSHINDMQYIFDKKLTASVHHVQMMPNAPMNEPSYSEKHQIQTEENGFIVSTKSADQQQIIDMSNFFYAVQFFYMIGVIKYIMYYLQVEHGIKSMRLIKDLMSVKSPDHYPISHQINAALLKKKDNAKIGHYSLSWKTKDSEFLFGNLLQYYNELFLFIEKEYGIHISESEKNTLAKIQSAVMPTPGKTFPFVADLEHDFEKYFEQIKSSSDINELHDCLKPLKSFAPGRLKVNSLTNKPVSNLDLLQLHTPTASGWELRSTLRFIKPKVKNITSSG